MRKFLIMTLVTTLGTGFGVSPATAKQSLQAVDVVENGLFAVAVADKIRRECGDISGRLLRARSFLNKLYDTARAEGYSDAEIDSYINSDEQKNRMRAKRDAFLSKQGVVKASSETYCAAGRAEIQKTSQIGTLLKAR
ncbi:MAG: DUF5333 domain-containing protein [Aliishimia sp.]